MCGRCPVTDVRQEMVYGRRTYVVSDDLGEQRLPSVTTVLRCWPAPELSGWRERQIAAAWKNGPFPEGKTVGEAAAAAIPTLPADRGRAAHKAVEWSYAGKELPDQWVDVAAAVRRVVDPAVDVRLTEAVLLGDGWAGTADMLGRRPDGRPCVLDLKTGKKVWDTHWAQVYAYSTAVEVLVDGRRARMPDGTVAGIVLAPVSGSMSAPRLGGEPEILWLEDGAYARRMWELSLQVHLLRKEMAECSTSG